jgi:hypothetical protein
LVGAGIKLAGQIGWNIWMELESIGLDVLVRAAFKLSGIFGLNWSGMGWNIWIELECNIWMEQESNLLELESNG